MTKELTQEEKELQALKEKVIGNIQTNYRRLEQSIVAQLYMHQDLHGTTIGSTRESIWRQLFEMIVPKKFVIEQSVFIMDAEGRISKEVDIAIIDETYTPYIFRYEGIKFVPIEAVAVVVECKSTKLDRDSLSKWNERITALRTSEGGIARTVKFISKGLVDTQKSTRPIRILCTQTKAIDEIAGYFDFILHAVEGKHDHDHGKIEISHRKHQGFDRLYAWYKELNFFEYEENKNKEQKGEQTDIGEDLKNIFLKEYEVLDDQKEPISLLTFNFQLNQLLMLINNPILFPHQAYAKLLNAGGKEQG